MMPSAFVALSELPKTPNGKVDRKALSALDQTQVESKQNSPAPRNFLEVRLGIIWEKALGIHPVGIRDNFFNLGGHSLLAVQVLSQIKKHMGKEIPVADFFKSPTIEQLADIIQQEEWSSPFSLVFAFQPFGTVPPFFCIHGGAADVATYLGSDQPFYGALPHGYDGKLFPPTVEEMAGEYIKEIRTLQPKGPYFIGGYSFGGMVAFEIALQLKKQGEKTGLLVLIDPTISNNSKTPNDRTQAQVSVTPKSLIFRKYLTRVHGEFMSLDFKGKIEYIIAGVWGRTVVKTGIKRKTIRLICLIYLRLGIPVPNKLRIPYRGWYFKKAAREYTPRQKYPGRAVLFRTRAKAPDPKFYWQKHVEEDLIVYDLPGDHLKIFNKPQVNILAEKLKESLERAKHHT